MKTFRFASALVALSLLPAAVLAETPKPPAPPAPVEMKALDSMLGDWTCSGTMPASEVFGPEQKTSTRVKVTREVGGNALLFRIGFKTLGQQPMSANILGLWYYDALAREYVAPSVDDMGASFVQKSKGFEGDVLTFAGSGTMMGKKVDPATDRFTRHADGTLSHLYEGTLDGKKIVFVDEVCKKSGKK